MTRELPRLRFAADEHALLRLHSRHSDGVYEPSRLARMCAARGLSVVALTDVASVGGTADMIEACAGVGVHALPGVELESREGLVFGYLFDPQDDELLAFLESCRQGARPTAAECVEAIHRAGGVGLSNQREQLRRHGFDEIPGEDPVGCDRVAELMRWLPEHSLHRDWFEMLRRRASCLAPDDFHRWLRPKSHHLCRLEHAPEIDQPAPGVAPWHGAGTTGFVIAGPGGADRLPLILGVLEDASCEFLGAQSVAGRPRLALRMQALRRPGAHERTRLLLHLELESHLFGREAERALVVLFAAKDASGIGGIGTALERRAGALDFHRVQYQGLVDVCAVPMIQVAEPELARFELGVLRDHGLDLGAFTSRTARSKAMRPAPR